MHRTSTMRLLAVALGTVALTAPAHALSAPAAIGCSFRSLAGEGLGQSETYTGTAWGYVVSSTPTNSVSIRCYVTVDGVEVTSTPTGTGTGLAMVSGQVTYTRSDTQWVQVRAEWTDGADSGTIDYETQTVGFPPQEVNDMADLALNRDVEFSDGETGFVEQSVSESASALFMEGKRGAMIAPPSSHDLSSGCTFKYARQTGLITVVGRSHAGRHPVAESTSIRCRLVNTGTGAVLYDQTRIEAGTKATLNDTFFGSATDIQVCNAGVGWWDDGDSKSVPLTCA